MSGIGAYAPQSMFHGGSVSKAGMMLNPITGNYDIPHTPEALAAVTDGSITTSPNGSETGPAVGLPAIAGATPGAKGQAKTPLPSYLYFDENRVVPYRQATNSQMIDTLRLLGLITDEDYAWFSSYFDRSPNVADGVWLEAYFNRPDESFNRESFFEKTDFDAETQARWNPTNFGSLRR